MKYLTRLVLVFSLLCNALFAQSQAPSTVSIQGTLMDAKGQAAKDGVFNVQFRLYDVPEAGTINWFEDATVETSSGIYSHYLGSVNPLSNDIFEKTQYLGIQVGSIEIAPRTLITYAPYTFTCNSAELVQKVICSGAVGDIKYSILNPGLFEQENGSCWVPMNGGNVFGSQWAIITGLNNVPNAGGMFFRSQEFVDGRDPERTPTTPVGNNQSQQFKSHIHTGNTGPGGQHSHQISGGGLIQTGSPTISGPDADFSPGFPEADVISLRSGNSSLGGGHKHNLTMSQNAGGDTRPRNLSLYAYIRVN